MNIRIHAVIKGSKVNGPGNRFVIWTQGCKKKCINCYNKNIQKKTSGTIYNINDLIYNIMNASLDGLTISGGEPFDQADALYELLKGINLPLGIICFTGYSIEEIRNDPLMNRCLEYIDLLIEGHYDDSQRAVSGLAGSKNQRFIFIDKKERGIELLGESVDFDQHVEVHIDDFSDLIITGFPDLDPNKLRQLGIELID